MRFVVYFVPAASFDKPVKKPRNSLPGSYLTMLRATSAPSTDLFLVLYYS